MVPFLRAGHICSYLQIHTQGLFQDFAPAGANASCPNMGGGGGGKYKLYLYDRSNCDCYICYVYSLLHYNTCIRANQISREADQFLGGGGGGGGGSPPLPPPEINPAHTYIKVIYIYTYTVSTNLYSHM